MQLGVNSAKLLTKKLWDGILNITNLFKNLNDETITLFSVVMQSYEITLY